MTRVSMCRAIDFNVDVYFFIEMITIVIMGISTITTSYTALVLHSCVTTIG